MRRSSDARKTMASMSQYSLHAAADDDDDTLLSLFLRLLRLLRLPFISTILNTFLQVM